MKKFFSCLIMSVFVSLTIYAQSSEQLSEILKSPAATAGQASYLAAVYANEIGDDDSEEQAFEALQKKGLFSDELTADSEVTLAQVSYVYMQVLGLKGGLFYTLFPSERYAFKELKAQGILPKEADPSMKMTGRDSIDIFNTCLDLTGDK
ncbi:MAG: hypothetical protein IJ727_09175 [Treponema sp.]|nr:hypothetical protein [Treponema sp.]